MSSRGPIAWLRDLVVKQARSATRLSEAEALRLAQIAADHDKIADTLEVMDVRTIQGRLCWVVGTTTKDASWSVVVDDILGETKKPEAWNGWSSSQ